MRTEWKNYHNQEIFPSRADADETRVWAITLFFEDGSRRRFDGEGAFWGTGDQAKKTAEKTAHEMENAGIRVLRFETELLPDE
jgi:hypothetical protein